MLSKENLEGLTVTLLSLLKDTSTVINCLQSASEAKKEEAAGNEVAPQLRMGEKVLHSMSTRLSLEKNHQDAVAFLEFLLKEIGQDETNTEEIQVDETNLIGR